jgi:hypothetical protein
MKHVKTISRGQPAVAQLEPLLQLVGLLSSVLALIQQYGDLKQGKAG